MIQLENIETATILDVNIYELENAIEEGKSEYKVSGFELRHIIITKILDNAAVNYKNTDTQVVLKDINSNSAYVLTRIQ